MNCVFFMMTFQTWILYAIRTMEIAAEGRSCEMTSLHAEPWSDRSQTLGTKTKTVK